MSTAIRRRRLSTRPNDRKGAMVVLAAILLVFVLFMVAFVVDLGYVTVARTEVQRAADSAAHAAVLEYRRSQDPDAAIAAARATASSYSLGNHVTAEAPAVDLNQGNDQSGDVVVGRYDFKSRSMSFGEPDGYNAVEVRIRRDSEMNGHVPLFFANLTGLSGIPVHGRATAALIKDVGGFSVPSSGQNVPFLPITVQVDYWYDELAKGNDDWEWDSLEQDVQVGNDGAPEVNIYPIKKKGKGKGKGGGSGTDGAGNFGTVNVGTSSNSTAHLSDIIENGLSQEHLDFHGGELALNNAGFLMLSGDPGISAGIKDELAAIIGKPVAMPLYETLTGNGNNAQYKIVKFVGVRLVEVELTGGDKVVMVQPAELNYSGVLPAPSPADGSNTGSSDYIFSPISIVH